MGLKNLDENDWDKIIWRHRFVWFLRSERLKDRLGLKNLALGGDSIAFNFIALIIAPDSSKY